MNRRGVWVLMVMSALMVLVCVPKAWGQRPPETHPGSTTQDIVMSWDRSALPGEIELIPERTVVAYERAGTLGYGQLFITCKSESDPSSGKCPTEDTGEETSVKRSVIELQFREERSGMTVDVGVQGALFRIGATAACYSDYWDPAPHALWSSYASQCNFQLPAGTAAGLRIDGSELTKLVAGRWRAQTSLYLRRPPHEFVANYEFNFDFTITDHNAVSIYFPQFESTTPLVNLDARYDPIQQTVGGRTVVDMCLYDGLGSQASYLAVTARDISPRSAGNSGFSLWHDSSGSDPSQRLDYTVTLDHNGARVPLSNGVEEQLTGIDSSQLRLVMLPGMSQPVFCVNTPMTLDMPRVPSTSKRSGIYWGDLQLELRVPAGTP